MTILMDVFAELFSMFVSDARLSISIILLAAVVAVMVRAMDVPVLVSGAVLLVGCVAPQPRVLRRGLVVCTTLLLVLTVQRTTVWASERSLWEDAARWTSTPRPHVRLALVARSEGRLEEAEAHLRLAIDADPTYAAAWNNLGNVQRQQGDPVAAEGSYERALALLPSYPEALTNIAALRVQQGRLDEARGLYERALVIHPGHDQMHNNLGTLLLRVGDWAAAEQHLRQALLLGGDSAAVWRNLSGALQGQERREEAQDALRQALAADPTYAPAWLDLGNLLLSAGQRHEAQKAWRNFLQHWRGDDSVAEGVRQLLRQEALQ